MICLACNNKLGRQDRFLECNQCHCLYHAECLNISKEQFTALPIDFKRTWTCPSCSSMTRRTKSNVNTPVRQAQVPPVEDSINMSCEVMCESPLLSQQDDNLVTMDKIGALLEQKLDQKLSAYLSNFMDNFRQALKDDVKKMVHAEIDSVIQHLKDDFSSTTNFMTEEQASLKQELDKKTLSIRELEAENTRVRNELILLNNRLLSIEKISRNKNLEIQAVPESRNENCIVLFRNLCKSLGLNINDDQIYNCRRIAKMNNSSDRPRNILVSLVNPRLRDDVLSACHRYNRAHKDNPLNTTHLGLPVERRQIYINEHLSPECKALHAAARNAAKVKKFKYVWVKYGRVYMRKADNADCVLIKNVECLNKLS